MPPPKFVTSGMDKKYYHADDAALGWLDMKSDVKVRDLKARADLLAALARFTHELRTVRCG